MKNILKIWPKLVEADRKVHEEHNLEIPNQLAEWVAKSIKGQSGRDISPKAAPLISINEMRSLLHAHGPGSQWGEAMLAVIDKEEKKNDLPVARRRKARARRVDPRQNR